MAIVALLDRRLDEAESLVGHVGEDFREALDRLIAAAEGRDRILADLARETRFRYFDQPVIEAAAAETYREAEAVLAALADDPDGAAGDRSGSARWSSARARSPRCSASACGRAAPALRRALLETMTLRYYRLRELGEFEPPRARGGLVPDRAGSRRRRAGSRRPMSISTGSGRRLRRWPGTPARWPPVRSWWPTSTPSYEGEPPPPTSWPSDSPRCSRERSCRRR